MAVDGRFGSVAGKIQALRKAQDERDRVVSIMHQHKRFTHRGKKAKALWAASNRKESRSEEEPLEASIKPVCEDVPPI
jgi:hypothetical protein